MGAAGIAGNGYLPPVQIGYGSLPNAILQNMKDKNDLGIHTINDLRNQFQEDTLLNKSATEGYNV